MKAVGMVEKGLSTVVIMWVDLAVNFEEPQWPLSDVSLKKGHWCGGCLGCGLRTTKKSEDQRESGSLRVAILVRERGRLSERVRERKA